MMTYLLSKSYMSACRFAYGRIVALPGKRLRVLKPGGYVRVAVPDGFHPDPAYIEMGRPGGYGTGSPGFEGRTLFLMSGTIGCPESIAA